MGFLYVTGHGLEGLIDRSLDATRRLFALPRDAKAAFDYSLSSSFRGYMALGVENTAGLVDQR